MSPERREHLLVCTFCKKDEKHCKKLVAGPGVYICDACVALCNRALEGKGPGVSALPGPR